MSNNNGRVQMNDNFKIENGSGNQSGSLTPNMKNKVIGTIHAIRTTENNHMMMVIKRKLT